MGRKIKESIIKEMISYYKNNNVSLQQVSNKFEVSKGAVHRHIKKSGVKVDPQRNKTGKKSWNTGLTKHTDERVLKYAKTHSKEYISSDGYRRVWSDDLNKTVREHHKTWFKETGYWPNTKIGEQIHHIDGDKLNNNFNNLVLCTVGEHTEIHKSYEQLVFILLKEKLVFFNKSTNKLEYKDLMCKLKNIEK